MSNYTENKNGISSFNAGQCIPECECGCEGNGCFDDDTKFPPAWDFLNDWDSWSDEEKAMIFVPYIEYINDSCIDKGSMGKYVSEAIAKRQLKYHTEPLSITFNLTANSQIITQLIYAPIYERISCTPNILLIEKIKMWGIDHKFISE